MSLLFDHKKTGPSPNDRVLSFRPEGISYIYSVLIRTSAGEDRPVTTLQYNMTVKHTGPAPTGSILQLDRSDVLVNGAAADNDLMYELGQQCGSAPYPLQLVLNKSGRIIDIFNHDDILERWAKTALYLRRYHTSDIALSYIDHTEAALKNKELLKSLLAQDLFFSVYFGPLYGIEYNNTLMRADYPVISFKKPVVFHVQQQLEKEEESPACLIRQEGKAVLPQQLADVFPGEEPEPVPVDTGSVQIVYELDTLHHHISSAEAQWTIDSKGTRTVTGIRIMQISDIPISLTIQTSPL